MNKHEDYKLIYSPRTSLYNEKIEEEKLYNELSKSFDPYTVKILKRHFQEHFGLLDRDLFIGILKEHLLTWYPELPNRENILIKLLIRLFNEIDLDSDHSLTWNEFSNYIIHVTNSKKMEYSMYNLQQYILSKETFEFIDNKSRGYMQNKNDADYNSNIIYYCFYINKLKSIGISYEESNKIIFYSIITLKKNGIIIDLLLTQNEIDRYEINELNEKTEEMLREQEEKIEKLLIKKRDIINMKNEVSKNNKNNKNEKTLISRRKKKDDFKYSKLLKRVMHIINTSFVEEYDLLFISTTNNKISSWKYDKKFNCFSNVNIISSDEQDFIFQKEDMRIPIFGTELPQYTMCFDCSTNNLYTGQKDGKILKWGMTSLKPVDIFDIEKDKQNIITKNKINLPIISKSSKILDTTVNSNNDLNNNENDFDLNKKAKITQDRKRESVSCLLILEGLRLLCSAYFTGQLVLWDTITKKPKKRYNDQQTGIYHVIFDTKKNYLYTCGFEHDIFIYDPYSDNRAAYKLKGHNGSVNSISLNPNINELVSIDILGVVKIWDTNKLICFQTFNINERILLDQNNVKREEDFFVLFSSNKKKSLSSNIHVEALPYVNKILVFGEKFLLYEKGDTSNPLLTDSNMILGCIYNTVLDSIMTFSSKSIKFWNILTGKLEKVYNDLMIISEITAYATDEEFKKIYLGDTNGKVKSFYLSSGEFLKEFESHKDEISFIFATKKYDFLITCSVDLCIKIHKLNDSNGNSIISEIYPCRENGTPFEKNLFSKVSLNREKGLLLIALTNGWIVDYDIEKFKFNLNLNPNYSESIRSSRISNVLDINEFDIVFVALENGEKYFLLKEKNKYFNQYLITFGNFVEEKKFNDNEQNNDNDNDNYDNKSKNKKNIVICSAYCHEEQKLFTGDHLGYISSYDLTALKNIFNQNYKKNEISDILKNNSNINLIYRKQSHKESITFIDIPFALKPKFIFSISTDRTVHLNDYYTGELIDSLKVISIKYEPVPIAIKYYKENPFIPKKNKNLKKSINKLSSEQFYKKEKEEEKEINNYIKKYYENKLNSNDKQPIHVFYRYFLEQNKIQKKPKVSYDYKENNGNIDTISYAYDLIDYKVKSKFINKIYNKNLLPYRSTIWNYNLDVDNLINVYNNDLQKIKKRIKTIENEIKETEKYFEKIPLDNNNYFPEYIRNLKRDEKDQINGLIFNKINTFNLAVTRKNTIKKEIQNILFRSEKKNNQSININTNTISTELNLINNSTENTLPTTNNKNFKNLPNIKSKGHKKFINNIDGPTIVNSISNSSENKINKMTLRKIGDKSYLSTSPNKYIVGKVGKIKPINLSKDFTDRRFLGYRNEFDEKYKEFKKPFETLLRKYNKNYLKLINKLPFNSIYSKE